MNLTVRIEGRALMTKQYYVVSFHTQHICLIVCLIVCAYVCVCNRGV